ncbi:hypothetical protein OB69_02740 [Roseivirga seohaensis subsp. aquiponti]|uniref:Uncharacterized protein n=1 Tax=Roseivirga seohaensis subsp. aquiponti TaxID=1566026 RepID=A0A0L8ANM4_9BACT|nr:hypothetical protein [Roseivirga seohaensis]KOF03944.1 hypothetical protein OB69_02740 [Roseivirga seohaensis subsp. aquiponti]|tara:strand:+ start:276 stop:521 length:246 start_codon:yes stop_codon:yes gene_type:complete
MSDLKTNFPDWRPEKQAIDPRLRKVRNRTQLADFYGCHINTLKRWLDLAENRISFQLKGRRSFFPNEILEIVDVLGPSPKD